MTSAQEYGSYLHSEWSLFQTDPSRAQASLAAVGGLTVERVLDLGCGAGQELVPFVLGRGAVGVGVDVARDVGRIGRRLFADAGIRSQISFLRARAEALPFQSGGFDVVVCRLALPYTENEAALAEIARVLRSGGVLLLKIHHARYYLRETWQGLRSADVRRVIHAGRVLLAGTIYHLTGRQPRATWLSTETFQTNWLLRRELRRRGMMIRELMPDTNPLTPSYLIVRAQ